MTKQENFKLPADLQVAFHSIAEKRGANRSAVLRQLVQQWISEDSPSRKEDS